MVGPENRAVEAALDRLVATPARTYVTAHGWQQTTVDGARLADPPEVMPATPVSLEDTQQGDSRCA